MSRILVGVLSASLVALMAHANAAERGIRMVVRVQIEKTSEVTTSAEERAAAIAARTLRRVLPQERVELEYLSDGVSVREVQHGPMLSRPDGTIVLAPADASRRYVLTPSEQTYYVVPGDAGKPSAAAALPIEVKRMQEFQTIDGFRAQRVVLTAKEPWDLPPGSKPPVGGGAELTTEYDSWCTAEVTVPPNLLAMLNRMGRTVAGPNRRALEAICPIALRSRYTNSLMPGFAIVSSIVSIAPASPKKEEFTLPSGYREVPAPGR